MAKFKFIKLICNLIIILQSISPGYVETEFAYRNGYTENEELAKLLKIVPRLASDDIADAVAYVLKTPPHVQVSNFTRVKVKKNFKLNRLNYFHFNTHSFFFAN